MIERELVPQKLRRLAREAALTELQRDELLRMAQHAEDLLKEVEDWRRGMADLAEMVIRNRRYREV